jgi:hypothetical protein
VKIVLLIPYLIVGSAFVLLSVPLIRQRIAPNRWYGFRVRRTLEDPKLWYAVNRYSAFHLLGLGVVMLAVAAICYAAPGVSFTADAIICPSVTLAGLAFTLIRSFRYLARLTR